MLQFPPGQLFILGLLCRSAGTAKPAYWRKPVYQLDPSDTYNNGFINDDFIVWMREAAFPNFKKLYGILDRRIEQFRDGLPAGNYSVSISYSILSTFFLLVVSRVLSLCRSTLTPPPFQTFPLSPSTARRRWS